MNRNKIFLALTKHVSVIDMVDFFGITDSAIYQWRYNGIPPDKVLDIEYLSRGTVSRHDMRPDVFGKRA